MVNGLQQLILFHVDDCNLSHKYTKLNESLIRLLHKEREIIFEDGYGVMQVNHGKLHNYLGKTLEYTTVGQVKTTMLEYIDEILDTLIRQTQQVVVLIQSLHQILFSRSTKNVRNSTPIKL